MQKLKYFSSELMKELCSEKKLIKENSTREIKEIIKE